MAVLFPLRSLGGVFIDVVMEESVEAEVEIPEHPVERGAKISDHAYRKPTIVKMTCVAADTTSWQSLYDLMKKTEPFDLQTGFDLFPSMLIQKLEPKRDSTTGQVLAFEVTAKEVIIVSSQQGSQGGNQGTGGDERAQAKTERGQVQARSVDTTSGRGETVLRGLEGV